jgi:hypothetical protein
MRRAYLYFILLFCLISITVKAQYTNNSKWNDNSNIRSEIVGILAPKSPIYLISNSEEPLKLYYYIDYQKKHIGKQDGFELRISEKEEILSISIEYNLSYYTLSILNRFGFKYKIELPKELDSQILDMAWSKLIHILGIIPK